MDPTDTKTDVVTNLVDSTAPATESTTVPVTTSPAPEVVEPPAPTPPYRVVSAEFTPDDEHAPKLDGLTRVLFINQWEAFNSGEKAAFEHARAAELVKLGVAVEIED